MLIYIYIHPWQTGRCLSISIRPVWHDIHWW